MKKPHRPIMKEVKRNFLGIPDVPSEEARFIVLPIPFEATTSFKTGTKNGPDGIIFSSNYLELYDEQLDTEPYLTGIKTVPAIKPVNNDLQKMSAKISKTAAKYVQQGKIVIGLGGEHTVSVGLVDACRKKYPDINVLCFDAHADLRNEYEGTKFSHACVSRRILEFGCRVFCAGIRSISREEKNFLDGCKNAEILWAQQMAGKNWGQKLNKKLPPGVYYISFDLDFLDPSILPETGTPEPGGFYWYETVDFLRDFISRQDISIAGIDAVELSPENKFSSSAFLAAKLIYKIIGYLSLRT